LGRFSLIVDDKKVILVDEIRDFLVDVGNFLCSSYG